MVRNPNLYEQVWLSYPRCAFPLLKFICFLYSSFFFQKKTTRNILCRTELCKYMYMKRTGEQSNFKQQFVVRQHFTIWLHVWSSSLNTHHVAPSCAKCCELKSHMGELFPLLYLKKNGWRLTATCN